MTEFAFVGNKHIRTVIAAAAARDTFSHAYILSGPKGSGRRTIALYMTAAILCGSVSARPCGSCSHCRKAAVGIHPDAVTIDNEGREFVVGQSRELRTDVFTRPNEAKYKVYVIANAQDMNRNAQNALLTVLEEPPPYAVFILLTDGGGILSTVRSRCTELKTAPVGADEAMEYLEMRFADRARDELSAAMAACVGNLGACVGMLEGGEDGGDMGIPAFLAALAAKDELRLFEASAAAGRLGREEFKMFLDLLQRALHEGLMLNSGAISAPDGRMSGEYVLNRLTNAELLHKIEGVQKLRGYCDFNAGTAHLAGMMPVILSGGVIF